MSGREKSARLLFLTKDGERAFAEKASFYRSQATRLISAGIAAEYRRVEDADLGDEPICIFDIGIREEVLAVIAESNVRLAPMIWNPYVFYISAQKWLQSDNRIVAFLAPGTHAGEILKKYSISKPIGSPRLAMDYSAGRGISGDPSERGLKIGHFADRSVAFGFVRGCIERNWSGAASIQWIALDFENPEAWRLNLPRCDGLVALRGLGGSALPLLDAMAAGVTVCADHGGGLLGLPFEDAGMWIEGSTLEAATRRAIEMLEALRQADPALTAMRNAGLALARTASADATFARNLQDWRALAQL